MDYLYIQMLSILYRLLMFYIIYIFTGFVVSCICDTERTATYLALGSFLPMIMLCGIIWPVEGLFLGVLILWKLVSTYFNLTAVSLQTDWAGLSSIYPFMSPNNDKQNVFIFKILLKYKIVN